MQNSRKFRFAACLLFLLIGCTGLSAQATGDQSVYEIAINITDPPSASVKAEISVVDGKLFMIGGAVNHLPRGWATYVLWDIER